MMIEPKNQSPLLSLIVLSYNNQEYIYNCLESIFNQDYPNIELVISDDASVKFNEIELAAYIKRAKTTNIVNTIVNINHANMGTVKHLEAMRERCSGKYIMSIAADDALAFTGAISALMSTFSQNDAEVVTSQVGMYDKNLCEKYGDFTSPSDAMLINDGNSQLLFAELATRCFIAASGTIYHKSVFNRIGILSDKYFIIEDWTSHLRIARENVSVKFINIVTVKHRDGGISHGNDKNSIGVYYNYRKDYVTAYENEILPFIEKIPQQYRRKIYKMYKYHKLHLKYFKYEKYIKKIGCLKKTLRKFFNMI